MFAFLIAVFRRIKGICLFTKALFKKKKKLWWELKESFKVDGAITITA